MSMRFSVRDLLWFTAIVGVVCAFLFYIWVHKPSVQRWEYHVTTGVYANTLTELGDQGYEVCGTAGNAVILKRPKQ